MRSFLVFGDADEDGPGEDRLQTELLTTMFPYACGEVLDLEEWHARTVDLLTEHRGLVLALADALMLEAEMTGERVAEVLSVGREVCPG